MRLLRGFTLIEFLVVMAIIAVIVSLLLPALVGARSASRRVNCINNLKQIELAIQSYLTSYNVLPSGTYDAARPVSSGSGGYQVSWIVSLLPYMEQSSLYHAFDFRHGAEDPANQTVRMSRISSLLCPSEGSAGRSFFAPRIGPANGVEPGRTSYAACHHDVEAPIAADNHGVFFLNSRISYDDLSDGPAFTIFAGEFTGGGPRLGWAVGTMSSLRNTGSPINFEDIIAARIPGTRMPVNRSVDLAEFNSLVNDGLLPPGYVGGYSSHHPGGANFLFGDGSVRFLSEKIRIPVYRSLGNRADGNLISDDEY
jgi:prepilin-type N-terminal cleavage/methylation domain-containing protein/prepilin-type processing-associated H-X9-DG protein